VHQSLDERELARRPTFDEITRDGEGAPANPMSGVPVAASSFITRSTVSVTWAMSSSLRSRSRSNPRRS